ncbi:MAG: MATE family efflux transporter [Candidatus Hydrogenedentota bacterium]
MDSTTKAQSVHRKILVLALPTVAYNLIEMGLGLTDLYMVRSFGSAATAALGMNRQILFLFEAIILAVSVGVVTLISQNLARGAKDVIERVVVQSLTLITFLAFGLGLFGYFSSPIFLALTQASSETADFAVGYLKIYCISLPFMAINAVSAAVLRASKNPMLPLKIAILMAVLNVSLNYGFIHGVAGFPELGVEGAAVGTLIVRVIGVVSFLIILIKFSPSTPLIISKSLPFDYPLIQKVLKVGVPIAIASIYRNAARVVFIAIAGFSVYSVSMHAAVGLGLQIRLISVLPALAFQVALATLVGDAIGREKFDEAQDIGRRGVWLLGALMSVVCGGIFLCSGPIARAFIVNPDDVALGATVLRWFSVGQFFSTLAIGAQGALIGTGDTKPVARIMFVTQWLILVPLAYALLVPMNIDPNGILIAWIVSPIITFVFIYLRFLSGKWRAEAGIKAPSGE